MVSWILGILCFGFSGFFCISSKSAIDLFFFKSNYICLDSNLELCPTCGGRQLWSSVLFFHGFPLTLWWPWLPHVPSSGLTSQKHGRFSNRVSATLFHLHNCDCPQGKVSKTLNASHFLQVSIPLCNSTALFSFQILECFGFCLLFSALFVSPPESILLSTGLQGVWYYKIIPR